MALTQRIVDVLGGEKTIHRKILDIEDFYEVINDGFPVKSANHLIKICKLTQEVMLEHMGVSRSTISRMKRSDPDSKLDRDASDHLYRVAYIYARACELFGDEEIALGWLHEPMAALNNESPFDKLVNLNGVAQVERQLELTEFGDYD